MSTPAPHELDQSHADPVIRLVQYVEKSTRVYRHGEIVKRAGGTVSIDAFPSTPASAKVIDCQFVDVGFTEFAATLTPDEFRSAIFAAADHGDWGRDRLAGGPSYIEIGAWLGDQTLAFRFMALGELHGLWQVVTPKRLGVAESFWDEAAGRGYVLISGLRAED